MRSLRWLASILLLTAVMGGTFATPAQARPSREICAGLGDSLSEMDLTWLRYVVRESYPVTYDGLLSAVALKPDTDGRLAGPAFSERENAIILPKRFLIRQCKMIQWQYVVIANPGMDFSFFGTSIDQCLKSSTDGPECLEKTIDRLVGAMRDYDTDQEFNEDKSIIVATTFDAVRFLMAHEAAHMVMRRTLSRRALLATDEEAEADLEAQISLAGNGSFSMGPLLSLATMSFIDTPEAADQTHPSADCRLRSTRALLTRTMPVIALVREMDSKQPLSRDSAKETVQFFEGIHLLSRPSPRTDCDPLAPATMKAVDADLQALSGLLDRMVQAGPKDERHYSDLMRFWREMKLKKSWARRLGTTAVASEFMRGNKAFQLLGTGAQGLSIGDMRGMVREVSGFVAALHSKAGTSLTPESLAEILVLQASLEFFSQPPGSSTGLNIARLKTILDQAFAYANPLDTLKLIKYSAGKMGSQPCVADFNETFAKAGIYALVELPSTDCADPASRDRLMISRALTVIRDTPAGISRTQCDKLKTDFAVWPRRLNWVP